MSRQRGAARQALSSVSLERAARLFRLVELLGEGPRTRAAILKRLGIDIRTYYRDLELLRDCRIAVHLEKRKYFLRLPAPQALTMLPFPDPCITLGEAQLLAKGRSSVHKKMRGLLKQITG